MLVIAQSQYVDFFLMAVFFGVLAVVPILWYVVGRFTYGSGEYRQS